MQGQAGWRGTLRDFLRVAGGYWVRDRRAWMLGLGLLVLNGAEVALLLLLNHWNRDLFDALERRDAQGVLVQGGVLLLLVGSFASLSGLHLLARRALALGWRSWLTARLTALWLAAGGREAGHANADGRIAEDARIATEEAVELACSSSHAVISLSCFVGVLWALSSHPPIVLGGVVFDVPGYLLWLAMLYAAGGMLVAGLLGRPLARATHDRQAEEAEYRAALVRARDGARAGQGARLAALFGAVGQVFHRQSRAYGHLQLFCVGNTRLGQGLPYLAATPAYLAGVVSLGWVMQAAQAFQQVAGALSWPVEHMPRIATWRASAERVVALHDAAGAVEPAPLAAAPLPPVPLGA